LSGFSSPSFGCEELSLNPAANDPARTIRRIATDDRSSCSESIGISAADLELLKKIKIEEIENKQIFPRGSDNSGWLNIEFRNDSALKGRSLLIVIQNGKCRQWSLTTRIID
jgi:hypothetical protein